MAAVSTHSCMNQSLPVSERNPAVNSQRELHTLSVNHNLKPRLCNVCYDGRPHRNEYVFGFDISVKDTVPVHVIDGFAELIHV